MYVPIRERMDARADEQKLGIKPPRLQLQNTARGEPKTMWREYIAHPRRSDWVIPIETVSPKIPFALRRIGERRAQPWEKVPR